MIAEHVLLQPAYLYNYTTTLAQSQAILSQFTAQAVAQHYAVFDVSRIVREINKRAAVGQAMGDFAERMIGDANLREGLMSGLASAYAAIPTNVAPLTTVNYDALLRTIVERFDEVGMIRSESLYHVVLWRMDGWLESLPPNVRQLFIAVIAALVAVIFQKAIDVGKDALKARPALHEKHVTPEHLDDVGGNMCR